MNEDALERLIEDTRKRMMLLTQRYGDEEITFAEWRTLFELEIRLLHMMAWALTYGMDAARRARTGDCHGDALLHLVGQRH